MRARIALIGATLGALAIGMATAATSAQTVVQGAFGGSSRIISPSVVAMWRARADVRSGPATLTFLVLWRGAPGWAMEGGSQTGSTSGMETELRMFQRYGRHELAVTFESASRTLTVQGKRIELGDANVVLVEDADQPGKTRVIKALKVDGSMPDGTARVEPVIRRVAELTEFMRCDLKLTDPNRQVMMDAICAQFIGQGGTNPNVTGPPLGVSLDRISWVEAKTRLTPESVVVIPLGAAAKEHGPHLTLSNDFIMANYFGRRVIAARYVVLAPPINYSYYPAFVNYPGSTTLTADTARDMVVQICKSLAAHGPKRFYILNTGVSTVGPLKAAQTALAGDGIVMRFTDILAVAADAVKAVTQQVEGTHADEIETSMMLYIAPTTVDMTKLVKEYPTGTGPLTPVQGAPGRFSASGVSGDATLATRAKGEKVVEATVAGILAEIDALRRLTVK